ncbi:pachytene checkpoint protein 2 [Basidiobolus meristosporus CBS 931.73]|uniref:Pachytene checkpoint protein 2 homolog n=1 Tax=Basidiobolus meristosporus CBS 931.73 TaxID=1314790 RepID=A0A1Y1YKN6_9FUNG|nr:pachytene checkpoint protein 2 [Basidiobolus meristosporus CBS 931.73]|eukprot:ORX98587.1 pachytene checkpoint protein 2 [Basidiobolus meristosporus CBS 931.73]
MQQSNEIERPVIHVECCLKTESPHRFSVIEEKLRFYLEQNKRFLVTQSQIQDFTDDPFLNENVESIKIGEASTGLEYQVYELEKVTVEFHIYQLNEEEAVEEMNEDENIPVSNHWVLPARCLDGLWESLVFDDNIQNNLLRYIHTTMLFSDRSVDANIISWNRIILLHGPPGTGKTSLCKALAQKLSIRLAHRYSYGRLIEINSHSLFSKWFSESGKLVMKMFQQIEELVEDEESFVCVLIDEVESLTAARKAAMSGSEPSDALRVVNAVLTQIDKLKRRKNVIILTTTNITEAIDLAFVDRADIKQYIGHPSHKAIYNILLSCLNELIRANIISSAEQLMDWRGIEFYLSTGKTPGASYKLYCVAQRCKGLSGRSLRKLPFLAHALFLQSECSDLTEYLRALELAITMELSSRQLLE